MVLPDELLIATRNRGKIREIEHLLDGLGARLRGLDEFPAVPEVEETGTTFAANATLKAQAYATQTGLWTVADDSGLAVTALNGAPGVYSARYGGAGRSDADRVQLLLRELTDVPPAQRQAQFVCVMAVADAQGTIIHCATGVCPGHIIYEPRGAGGFGYDPVFVPDGYERTFAELPAEVKNSISHRARALQAVTEFWRKLN